MNLNEDKPLFIAKDQALDSTIDFNFLKSEAIKIIQKYAGAFWTDFNDHDPGVTILDQLCYAILDLAYRTDFSIPDLLNIQKAKHQSHKRLPFYLPHEILSCNPITWDDFRKIILDAIEPVDGVWFYPLSQAENDLWGLCNIYIHIDAEYAKNENFRESQVIQEVKRIFSGHRNLCEDFAEVIILKPLYLALDVDIEIDSTENIEEILAEIYFKVESFFLPNVPFYTKQKLIDEGWTYNEIYEGPLLKHGFIKDEDLKDKVNKVSASDVIRILGDIKGIRTIKNLNFLLLDASNKSSKEINLNIDQIPKLMPIKRVDENTINFTKNGIAYKDIQIGVFEALLNEKRSNAKPIYIVQSHDFELPLGQNLDFKEYTSLQYHFPSCYGVGAYGLPNSVPVRRKAQALQLGGYLLLFEQILADYLAQLAHVSDLLSYHQTANQSYYFQHLDALDIPGVSQLLTKLPGEFFNHIHNLHLPGDYKNGYEQLRKLDDNFLDRRNRILDFLLAIHGESYTKLSNAQKDFYKDEEEFAKYSLDRKSKLLHFLPELNRLRSKGMHYLAPPDSTESTTPNLAGLSLKLMVLLGLDSIAFSSEPLRFDEGIKRLSLRQSIFETLERLGLTLYESAESMPEIEKKKWLEEVSISSIGITGDEIEDISDFIINDELNAITLEENPKADDPILQKIAIFKSKVILADFLRNGMNLSCYRYNKEVNLTGTSYYLIYNNPENKQEWFKMAMFKSHPELLRALKTFFYFLQQLNSLCEKLLLIEHILLRPPTNTKQFGISLKDESYEPFLYSTQQFSLDKRQVIWQKLQESRGEIFKNREGLEVVSLEGEKGLFQIQWKITLDIEVDPENTEKIELIFKSLKPNKSVQNVYDQLERFYKFISINPAYEILKNKISLYYYYPEEGIHIPEDFFSARISLILPNWTARFYTQEFQALVNHLQLENKPAHISSDIYWLSVEEMKIFEPLYLEWIGLLKDKYDLADEILIAKSQALVIFLWKKYQKKMEIQIK